MLKSQILYEGAIIEPEKMNEAKVEFLKTDLDVGITFVKIARTSADPETVSRNQRNARKAYDAVAHFLSTVTLTQIERENINTKMERLKSALVQAV